jgi:hypothetical protein
MQMHDILRQLKRYDGKFQRKAVQAAIANQEQITPELLAILEYATANTEALLDRPNYMGHLYAMFLLAQFREERAYPLLVDFCSIDSETIDSLLGDTITEGLSRILASVSGGDPGPMKSLVENEAVNEWVRSAALNGMTALVAQGAQPREDTLAYFQSLFREKLPREEHILWGALVNVSTDLYPDVVYEDIQQAFTDDLIDLMYINLDDVDEVLARDKDAVLENLKTDRHYTYIEDTIKEMEWWYCFQPPKPRQVPGQIVTKQQKIGRNEPCPCGSGQKYKRCCGKRQ